MTTSILMALRYLWGRKLRTALTTLAVTFGVAVLFGGSLTMPGAMAAFRRLTLSTAGAVDLSVTSRSGGSFAPEPALGAVAGIRGVQAASAVLRWTVPLPSSGGAPAQAELIGVDPATAQSVRTYRLVAGRFLRPGDSGVVVIASPAGADPARVEAGSRWALATAGGARELQVVGVLEAREGLTMPQAIVTLGDAQTILGQPGAANTLEFALAPGSDREGTKRAVLGALGEGFQADAISSQVDATASLQVGYAIFYLLGLMGLFVAAFLIFNTFRTVILERQHDLGMLRALGAERRQVTLMILVEGLLQGAIGTALGLALGLALAAGFAGLFNHIGPEYLPGIHVRVEIYPSALIQAAVFGLLTAVLASYLPARAAGKVSPLEALRPTPTSQVRRAARWSLVAGAAVIALGALMMGAGAQTAAAGAIFSLMGLAVASPGLVLPVARLLSPLLTLWFAREGDIARGNLARQPGRAAITASTLMIGLAMLVVSVSVVASLSSYVVALFNRSFSSDLVLMPQSLYLGNNLGADESLAGRLRALNEVQAVGTLRYGGALVNGQTVSVMGIDPVAQPQVSPLTFSSGGAEEAYRALASARAAIANPVLAASLGLRPGDELTLQTVEGPRGYRVVAVGGDALNFKLSTLFVSQANLQADLRRSDDLMLMIKLKPGASVEAARRGVEAIVADYPQFTLRVTADYRQQLTDETNQGMKLFHLLAAIILVPAALGLVNTLTINVLERRREIGTLRAVGASRRQVQRMVTAESLFLGLFGACIGVIAGVAMSYGFVAAFTSFGWGLPYVFPAVGIVAALVMAVLIALVASILPARNAARLEIVRALQYE